MSLTRSIVVNIIGRDNASSSFLRVSKAADKAANSTDRAIARFAARSKKMQAVGQKMSKSITLPLLALGAVSVDQAVKFQKSLTVLNTATGESVKNLGKVGSGIKQIAVDTGTTLGQLSNGMYLAEKAGFSLSKGGLTVLKAAAQGAKAENVDLSVAMTALTSIMTSYGLKASDAVKVENELIVGSGMAKTTMTDFANSLSNVVPIAAGLHISFAQVAGAIATMTQHGETSQRATENLANLMTNLAGSNNVATTAMQQLGVPVVNLQKNLGRRGLTGSLEIVLNALKKHGKAGMVVYDTFRKSSLATQSMKEQLDAMTGPLKKNSKAFADGKMGYKDYQKFFRSLGGKDFALGSQFAASIKSFKGFNNLVRQGRGDRQTYAKWLQQALGGVTGLKAMLMLLGGNFEKQGAKAGSFAGRVKKVADAAKEGGQNVHGWAEISKTASVKFDKMKAKLQVLSETIGEKLLPYVVTVAGYVGGLVDKFNALSHTQKKVIGWSLVVIAAIGPVMSILGRLGGVVAGAFRIGLYVSRFVRGIALANSALSTYNTAAYQAGFKIRAGLSQGISAARGLSSALLGLGTGVLIGQMTKGAGTAGKVGAVIASAGTGAAIGWSVGGPWGAAIGGVTSVLGTLGSYFIGTGGKAKQGMDLARLATAQVQQQTDDLLSSLKAVNGAYDTNYKQQTIDSLMTGKDSQGHGVDVLARARQVGFDQQKVVQAALGDRAAQKAFLDTLYNKGVTGGAFGADPDKAVKIFNSVRDALNTVADGAANAESKVEDYNRAQGKNAVLGNVHANSVKALGQQFKDFSTTLGSATGEYRTAMNDYSFFSDSAFGRRNRQLIVEHAQAIGTDAEKMLKHGKTVKQTATWVENQVSALHLNLTALGFNSKAVGDLIAKYTKLPRKVVMDLIKRGVTPADIQAIADKLGLLPSTKDIYLNWDDENARQRAADMVAYVDGLQATIRVATITGTKMNDPRLNDGASNHAKGGPLGDGYFTVGERGWELGYKRGNSVMIYDNKTSQKMTGWDRVPGFAKGTSGSKKPDQSTLSQKVSDSIGRIGQQYNSPFDTSQVGLPRLAGQIADAIKTLRAEVAKGLSKKLAQGFEAQIKRLAKIAEQQLGAIRLRIKGSDLTAISKGLAASVDEGKTAYDKLVADMKAAGASAAQLSRVRANESAALANDTKLLAAKDYRSTISDTLKGSFDSTQYGSVEDLLAGLGGATSTNRSYSKELTGLRGRAKGNSGLLAFINQLATSGQTATLQTLAGASTGELSQVSKAVSSYNASVASGSDAAEITKFGQSVNALVANQDHLASALAHVAQAFLKDSAKPLKVHLNVNGKEIAAEIVHTKEFDKELAALLDAVVNHHTYKH